MILPLKIHIIIYIMTIFHTETEDEIHIISMRKAEPMKSTPSPTTSKPPRLRVGLKDVSREEFSAAVQEQSGTQRVSIMLKPAFFDLNDTQHEPSDEQLETLMEAVAEEARRRAQAAREQLMVRLQAEIAALHPNRPSI